ncbi:MAG: hypothetical protein ACXITV_01765 [Luteibaculaceae bacterium]
MDRNTLEKALKALLFKRVEVELPPQHEAMFLQKLQAQKPAKKSGFALRIAAALVVLLGVSALVFQQISPGQDEVYHTEVFAFEAQFTQVIEQELMQLKSFQSPEVQPVIDHVKKELDMLDAEYANLKALLGTPVNDKEVMWAMMENFQARVNLLQMVIENLEELQQLNDIEHETSL